MNIVLYKYHGLEALIIKPKALKLGDTLGVVAPASPALLDKTELARNALIKMGFNVKMGKSCFSSYGYLAGSNHIRVQDINRMFLDDEVDGIICLKGGYGTPKILDALDYNGIRTHPKVFIGYSDITALHIAINQKCDLVTFHGPMAVTDIAEQFDTFSKENLLNAIMNNKKIDRIANPQNERIQCLVGGEAEGELIGGNLTLITATLGTPYEIATKGKLLFLEDVGEKPYKIDRMLTQLYLAGKLQDANGIILGDWKNCIDEDETSLSLMEVFEDILIPLNKPTLYNLKAGHCKPMVTLPFGIRAYMNANRGELIIKESATK